MKFENIDQLLEKYWEGETNLQEEKELRAYFNANNIAERHKESASIFQFYKSESLIKMPEIKSESNKVVQLKTARKKPFYFYRIAAIGLVMLASIIGINKVTQVAQSTNYQITEVEDPKQALLITKHALALVKSKINTANSAIKENVPKVALTNIIKNKIK